MQEIKNNNNFKYLSQLILIQEELRKVIIGQDELIDNLLIALISGGHILLEGMPGLAKTLSANSLAKAIDAEFKRIQFTPDLLPADLTGTDIFLSQEGKFEFQPGPIFSNIILADEINRAPAKVQSALLESMAEKQITIANKTYKLSDFFLVVATQNPIEQEGTYNLPEAQLDRFLLHISLSYPSKETELAILENFLEAKTQPTITKIAEITDIAAMQNEAKEVYVEQSLKEYIVALVNASRNLEKYDSELAGLISTGASPRATIGLYNSAKAFAYLQGDSFVTPFHIQKLLPNILRHRITLSFHAEAENISKDEIIQKIIDLVAV